MNYQPYVEERFDAYVKDLDDLVSIESVRDVEHAAENAPFGPRIAKALDTLLEMGKRDGFVVKNYDGNAGVITLGEGEESVGVLGHLDIVPLGDGWSKNPLKVTEENGYLYGRGVLDDKGPLLAGYYAMKIIKDLQIPLKKKIMLIAGTDEESGMGGIKAYLKNGGPVPDMGFTPDADFPVIYGEKGHIHIHLDSDDNTIIESFEAGARPNIVIEKANAVLSTDQLDTKLFDFYLASNGLKGHAEVKDGKTHLYMEGTAAHGSMPYLGVNAGVYLLNYIGQAYNDQLAKDLYHLLKDWKGSPENIDINGAYMGFLTMNPGIITIKDHHANVVVDIRYPNDTTPEQVINGFTTACAELASDIQATMPEAGQPLFVDPNSKLVTDLMGAYADTTGDTFHPAITIGGGTYAKMFDNFVAFGPEKPWNRVPKGIKAGGCHEADEAINIDDLKEAIAIYTDALVRLAGE